MTVDALSLLVQHSDLGLLTLGKYYLFFAPEAIHRMIPIACVLSAVFTLSGMAKNHEIVALYSLGLGLGRIALPILAIVSGAVFFNYFIGEVVLPEANQQRNFIFYHEIRKQPSLYSTVKKDKIWYRAQNMIYNIRTLDQEKKEARGLTLYYLTPDWQLAQMMTADEVHFQSGQWKLQKGSVTVFTGESSFPLTKDFAEKTIVIAQSESDLTETDNSSDVQNRKKLSHFISRNKEAGLETTRYEVDYHSKLSFPFSALVMVLVAIPFAVSHSRSGGSLANIGIVLLLVFFYWILYSSALALGKFGHLQPWAAAWMPNILTVILGLFLTFKPRLFGRS